MRFLTPRRACIVSRNEDPFVGLHGGMDQWISTLFGNMEEPKSTNRSRLFGVGYPKVDVIEDEEHVEVMAELPGMKSEDIELKMSEGVLTIKGTSKTQEKDESKTYHHVERSFGSFERKLLLPAEVEEEDIKASYKNGMLRIEFKKTKAAKVQVREIPVTAE